MTHFRGNPMYDLEARPFRLRDELVAVGVWSLLVVVLALVISCAIQRYAIYDYWTDQAIMDLHDQTMTMLNTAADEFQGGKAVFTADHESFYLLAYKQLDALILRASKIDHNDDTVANLEGLVDSFQAMQELHQGGFASLEQIQSSKTSLNSHFLALLFLEQAKKERGK